MSIELTNNNNSIDLRNINISEGNSLSRSMDFRSSKKIKRTKPIPMKKRDTIININLNTETILQYEVTDLRDKMKLTYKLSDFLTKPATI